MPLSTVQLLDHYITKIYKDIYQAVGTDIWTEILIWSTLHLSSCLTIFGRRSIYQVFGPIQLSMFLTIKLFWDRPLDKKAVVWIIPTSPSPWLSLYLQSIDSYIVCYYSGLVGCFVQALRLFTFIHFTPRWSFNFKEK